MTTTFLILAATVVLFVWNRLPVELVAVGATLALYGTGVLTVNEAMAGFGDPAVILIAALFVVSEGLDATGVTAWAGQQVIERVGESRQRLIVLMMGLVSMLTALISVNGAVAALVPMVVVLALRTGRPTSQLLMPLAFGAHAGSMLALTGTPVNVLVSDAAHAAGVGPFGFFEFTLVGVPLVVGTTVMVLLLGQRLLRRGPRTLSRPTSAITPAPCLASTCETIGCTAWRSPRVHRAPGSPRTRSTWGRIRTWNWWGSRWRAKGRCSTPV